MLIPLARLEYYEIRSASLDIYEQAVTVTPAEEKFYSQIKELNKLQLFSNNGIPCVEELDAAYKGVPGRICTGGRIFPQKLIKSHEVRVNHEHSLKTILGGCCGQ